MDGPAATAAAPAAGRAKYHVWPAVLRLLRRPRGGAAGNVGIVARQSYGDRRPSGCGKSTFLRAINRMNDLIPQCRARGTMLLDDQERVRPADRRHRAAAAGGHGFPEAQPVPQIGVRKRGLRPADPRLPQPPRARKIVEKSLRKAALWDEVKDRLTQCPGAFRRTATAAVHRAGGRGGSEILLMDEPTSALDPQSTARIEDLIGEFRGNYTVIMVTHNMQQAARVSDFTAFFFEGEMVEFGPTKQIFTKPSSADQGLYHRPVRLERAGHRSGQASEAARLLPELLPPRRDGHGGHDLLQRTTIRPCKPHHFNRAFPCRVPATI